MNKKNCLTADMRGGTKSKQPRDTVTSLQKQP